MEVTTILRKNVMIALKFKVIQSLAYYARLKELLLSINT